MLLVALIALSSPQAQPVELPRKFTLGQKSAYRVNPEMPV